MPFLLTVAMLLVIIYFSSIRPQKRKVSEQKVLTASLKLDKGALTIRNKTYSAADITSIEYQKEPRKGSGCLVIVLIIAIILILGGIAACIDNDFVGGFWICFGVALGAFYIYRAQKRNAIEKYNISIVFASSECEKLQLEGENALNLIREVQTVIQNKTISRTSAADELAKLRALKNEGLLTDEDWEKAKGLYLGVSVDKRDKTVELIRKLHDLHKYGALSESEFNMKKWDILSGKELR